MTEITMDVVYAKACQILGETTVRERLTAERLVQVEAERDELIGTVESARSE